MCADVAHLKLFNFYIVTVNSTNSMALLFDIVIGIMNGFCESYKEYLNLKIFCSFPRRRRSVVILISLLDHLSQIEIYQITPSPDTKTLTEWFVASRTVVRVGLKIHL